MSDFDKRLSNMMNEDEHSPNMQSNWERLSPRLQPPQPLKRASLQKRWLVGIAASVSVLAVSAMSYFLVTTHQENEALKNEVNNFKNKTQDIDNKIITHKDNISNDKEGNVKNAPSAPENKVGETANVGSLSADKTVQTTPNSTTKTGVNESNIVASNSIKTPVPTNKVVSKKEKTQTEAPSVFLAKKEVSKKIDNLNKENKNNIAQNEPLNPSIKLENNAQIVSSENTLENVNKTGNSASEPILNDEKEATAVNQKADLTVSPLGIMLKPTISNSTTTPLSIERALMLSPAILRSTPRSGRLAIGVQTFISFGDDEGRDKRGPALSGLGLMASYDLSRRFEITASADLGGMRYDFRDNKPRGNRIPKGPEDPPKDHPKLKGVSGKQDRQQFSIGLKYKIPTNTFLTPYLNVGYDLQRLGKQSCKFDFINETTNTEISVQQEESSRISNNLWHSGIGLEAKVSSFIIGVSAEYQKDFSINNDNRLILRGGVKYHF